MSFFWHVTHFTVYRFSLQIWMNTYVNPVELVANVSRILCLSCCWKKLVFLLVIRLKA